MKRTLLILVFTLLGCPAPVSAVTVTNLYQAEVPVTDQSASARSAAVRNALVQVMIKLTGNRNAASIYGVDDLRDRADQLLQQYEYRTVENNERTQARLWVRFDSRAIDDAMREYNIPVWGQERPSTLVWLVIKDELGQRFASLDENSRYFAVLEEQASARGITFITPLFDLQDAASIKTDDVINANEQQLRRASERYQPDAVLAGAVIELGAGLWQGNWLAGIQGQTVQWTSSGDRIELVLSEGMDGMADQLAARFAQPQGFASENIQTISVQGINSFANYARALKYLESLNFVSAVEVKSLGPDHVVYSLITRGGQDTLNQALVLGRVMQPSGAVGEYQLLP